MTQSQTVLGLFDTIAEAQQAVQLLLARGFTHENVELSTRTSPTTTSTGGTLPTESNSSGRFFSSLFASWVEVHSQNGILITVQTQSAVEAKQVADLLDTAGATNEDERNESWPDVIRRATVG